MEEIRLNSITIKGGKTLDIDDLDDVAQCVADVIGDDVDNIVFDTDDL